MQTAVAAFSAALLLQCIGCSRSSLPTIARLSARPSSTYALVLFAPASPTPGSPTPRAPSGYRLTYWRLPTGDHYTTFTLPANARSYVIRHLQPSSEYVVRVAAVDKLARGPFKAITIFTQPEVTSQPGTLSPPVNLHVDVISANWVHVTWEDGDRQEDGDDDRQYRLRYRRVGQLRWSETMVTGLQITITELEPNMQYIFVVKVIVGDRQSHFSMPVTAFTQEGQ